MAEDRIRRLSDLHQRHVCYMTCREADAVPEVRLSSPLALLLDLVLGGVMWWLVITVLLRIV